MTRLGRLAMYRPLQEPRLLDLAVRLPAPVDVEHRMEDRLMGDLDETILLRPNVDIDVPRLAQRIVLPKSGEGHDPAALQSRRPDAFQNIRRLSRRTDR